MGRIAPNDPLLFFNKSNAEPHMETHATYRVPSNNDRGVAVLIDAILATH